MRLGGLGRHTVVGVGGAVLPETQLVVAIHRQRWWCILRQSLLQVLPIQSLPEGLLALKDPICCHIIAWMVVEECTSVLEAETGLGIQVVSAVELDQIVAHQKFRYC